MSQYTPLVRNTRRLFDVDVPDAPGLAAAPFAGKRGWRMGVGGGGYETGVSEERRPTSDGPVPIAFLDGPAAGGMKNTKLPALGLPTPINSVIIPMRSDGLRVNLASQMR